MSRFCNEFKVGYFYFQSFLVSFHEDSTKLAAQFDLCYHKNFTPFFRELFSPSVANEPHCNRGMLSLNFPITTAEFDRDCNDV